MPDHKDSVRVEGRLSDEHTHNDGTKGKDTYAEIIYSRDGKDVAERRASGWGHGHWQEDSTSGNSDSRSEESSSDSGGGDGGSGK